MVFIGIHVTYSNCLIIRTKCQIQMSQRTHFAAHFNIEIMIIFFFSRNGIKLDAVIDIICIAYHFSGEEIISEGVKAVSSLLYKS